MAISKEIKKKYKSINFKAGIFQIINKTNQKIFLKISTDLDRAFNSDLFQLNASMHSNSHLQSDWNQQGKSNFEFKIFDELKYKSSDTQDEIVRDLNELLNIHLQDLKEKGELLYN